MLIAGCSLAAFPTRGRRRSTTPSTPSSGASRPSGPITRPYFAPLPSALLRAGRAGSATRHCCGTSSRCCRRSSTGTRAAARRGWARVSDRAHVGCVRDVRRSREPKRDLVRCTVPHTTRLHRPGADRGGGAAGVEGDRRPAEDLTGLEDLPGLACPTEGDSLYLNLNSASCRVPSTSRILNLPHWPAHAFSVFQT